MKSNAKARIRALTRLAQLDIDAVMAYEQAIVNIDESEVEIIEALENFQDDHVRHIDELSDLIQEHGVTPPEFERDAKGVVIEGMTKAMSKIGTRSALIAMTQNEMLTNAGYKTALKADLSEDERMVVEANYLDEQRHLKFITQALREKFGMAEQDVTRPSPDNIEEAQFNA